MLAIRLAAAVTLALGFGIIASSPARAHAGDCPTRTVEDALRASEIVVSGHVNGTDGSELAIWVSAWFHGADPVPELQIASSADPAESGLEGIGEPVVVAGQRDGDRVVLDPCVPSGRLNTPAGDALLATVRAVFGPGVAPGCWPHRPLADFVEDWQAFDDGTGSAVVPVVAAGEVSEDLGIVDDAATVSYRFSVEQWFGGPEAYAEIGLASVWTPDRGRIDAFAVGDRLIIASGMQGGRLGFVDCQPHATLGTREAADLLAQAEAVLGPPVVPAPDDRLPVASGTGFSVAMWSWWITSTPVGLVVVGVMLGIPVAVGLLAVRARRRRD